MINTTGIRYRFRAQQNAEPRAEFSRLRQQVPGLLGSPRIQQEFRAAGHPLGRHRVDRLRQGAQIKL
jgi:hypothetical protein